MKKRIAKLSCLTLIIALFVCLTSLFVSNDFRNVVVGYLSIFQSNLNNIPRDTDGVSIRFPFATDQCTKTDQQIPGNHFGEELLKALNADELASSGNRLLLGFKDDSSWKRDSKTVSMKILENLRNQNKSFEIFITECVSDKSYWIGYMRVFKQSDEYYLWSGSIDITGRFFD